MSNAADSEPDMANPPSKDPNQDNVDSGEIRVKTVMRKIAVCPQCRLPVDENNRTMRCKECNKSFCENCEKMIQKEETFYDGIETRKLMTDYPLCENCYKLSIKKQKELFTMHRRFLQLRESLPPEAETWFSTAEQFRDSGLIDLAGLCFNEAINNDETILERVAIGWEVTGIRFLNDCKYERAVRCFDEALTMGVKSKSAWLSKGEALLNLDRLSDALVSYDKVLQLDENNFEALSKKGLLLAKMKNPKGATKYFDKAMEVDSSQEIVWICKSQYHSVLEEYNEAINCANRAIEINSTNPDGWRAKCEALFQLNDYLGAIECSEKVVELIPQSAIGWKYKAESLERLNRFHEAFMAYERTLNLDPDGCVINIEEIQDAKQLVLEQITPEVAIPDWMVTGAYTSYSYVERGKKGKYKSIHVEFSKASDTLIQIIETTPKGEKQTIDIDLSSDDFNGQTMFKYLFLSDFNEGDKIRDQNGKNHSVKKLEALETPFGTIDCWRLGYNGIAGQKRIKVTSWFDSETGILIRRIFDKQTKNKQLQHWELEIQDSNISAFPEKVSFIPSAPESIEVESETVITEEQQEPIEEVEPSTESQESLTTERSQLAQEAQKLKLERDELNKIKDRERKNLEEEYSVLDKERREIEQMKIQYENDRIILEKEKKDVQDELHRLSVEKAKFTNNKLNFEEQQNAKLKQIEEARHKLKETRTRDNEERKKLKAEQRKYEEDKKKLIKYRNKFKEEKENMKAEKHKIIKWKQKLKHDQAAHDEEKMDFEATQEKFEAEKKSYFESTGDIDEKQQFLNDERQKLETERKEFKAKKEELVNEKAEIDAEKEHLENEREELKNERGILDKDRSELDSEIETINRDRAELDTEREKLSSERIEFDSEKEKIEIDRAMLDAEREKLIDNRAELDGEFKRLETEKKDLEKDIHQFAEDKSTSKLIDEKEEKPQKEIQKAATTIDETDKPTPESETKPRVKDTVVESEQEPEKEPEGEVRQELESAQEMEPEQEPKIEPEKESALEVEVIETGKKSEETSPTGEDSKPELKFERINEDEINSLTEQFEQFKKLSKKERKEIISKLKDMSDSFRDKMKEIRTAGFDVTKFRKAFGNARKSFKNKKYLKSLENFNKMNDEIINLCEQSKAEGEDVEIQEKVEVEDVEIQEKEEIVDLDKQSIEQEIIELEQKIREASQKYPTASANGALSMAKKELGKNNIDETKKLIEESNKLLDDLEKHYLKSKEIINNVEQNIKKIEKSGFDISEPNEILAQMKQAFDNQKYLELPKLKTKCLVSIEQSRKKYSEVLDRISLAQQQLTKQRKKGYNVTNSLKALKDAKKLLIKGDYTAAQQMVEDALSITIDSSKQRKEIEDKLAKLASELKSAKKKNLDIDSAEEKFHLAREAFEFTDNKSASKYLDECEQLLTELFEKSKEGSGEKEKEQEKEDEVDTDTKTHMAWDGLYYFVDNNPILVFTIQRLLSDQDVMSLTASSLKKDKLIKKYIYGPDTFIWLTNSEVTPEAVAPNDLVELSIRINKFIENAERNIIIIDSFELLIKNNGIENCLEFLLEVKDFSRDKFSIFIITLNPKDLSTSDLKAIEKIAEDLKKVDIDSVSKLL
jgi:tetratricopeptide (TPR) repeat protein